MTQISKEYALALFELASEDSACEQYASALHTVRTEFENNPHYMQILNSPNIPTAERQQLLDRAFCNTVPEHVLSFLKILCKSRSIRIFNECAEEFNRLYDAMSNISCAQVVSATELTDSEKQLLQEKLEKLSGHTVKAEYKTDAGLLGGLVVNIDGKVIDGSLLSKLKKVKEVIG